MSETPCAYTGCNGHYAYCELGLNRQLVFCPEHENLIDIIDLNLYELEEC